MPLHPWLATGLGVIITLIVLRIVAAIPLVGDLVVGGLLLVGVGAVIVTYYGAGRFRPDPLPD